MDIHNNLLDLLADERIRERRLESGDTHQRGALRTWSLSALAKALVARSAGPNPLRPANEGSRAAV